MPSIANPIQEPPSEIDASVVVCTYNRCESLRRTLAALRAQVAGPELSWEILVVDNNSSDATKRVVEEFASTFPRARYLYERNQGLSHARNTGIAAARGHVILFTDDDVAPEPEWVQRMVTGMVASGCDAAGGYIAPVWESSPPNWLTQRFHGFLAIKTERTDTYEITEGLPLPFGANMAFKREVFTRLGLFDVNRGRKGAVLASGEDGEFFARLLASGGKVMFFGDARVHHAVESFRLTKRYFRKWRYQTSRNLAQSRGFAGERRLAGIPLYLYGQLLRACGRAIAARFTDAPDEAFYKEMIVWHFLGSMEGLWRDRARTPDATALGNPEC
ncbi:MAG TPA: glycosyltransferase [Burkholderiales bacterium]|nr:glycosyltransferase [Burkholderiales bacterium]